MLLVRHAARRVPHLVAVPLPLQLAQLHLRGPLPHPTLAPCRAEQWVQPPGASWLERGLMHKAPLTPVHDQGNHSSWQQCWARHLAAQAAGWADETAEHGRSPCQAVCMHHVVEQATSGTQVPAAWHASPQQSQRVRPTNIPLDNLKQAWGIQQTGINLRNARIAQACQPQDAISGCLAVPLTPLEHLLRRGGPLQAARPLLHQRQQRGAQV